MYVETTIPGFYHETRTASNIVARREWTRRWWADARTRDELVTSKAVLDELQRGPTNRREAWLDLVRDLPLLPIEPAVMEVVAAYGRHKLMPLDPYGDALHVALASFHPCDFLVTWNCRHIANARKFGHLRRVNAMLGLATPSLVTPLELLGEDDEADRDGRTAD